MGLREIAQNDLGKILEDDAGFAWSFSITNPAGVTVTDLKGFSNDIALVVDPSTGVAVSGRTASLSVRISLLTENGLSVPVGISDSAGRPWIIEFDDINGNACKFKVSETHPDRTLGIVVCMLEVYK